jgi:hypothetical protein
MFRHRLATKQAYCEALRLHKERENMKQDLSKAAMLVSVNIVNGGLLGERKDQEATELVRSTYDVADKRAKASKYLIDRKHKKVKAVVAAAQRVRETLYKYTNPWGDDKGSSRLLVVKLEPELRRNLDYAIKELKGAWKDYYHVYPQLVADSEKELGKLFDRAQYPDPDRIMELFKVNVRYWPFPDSGHFVADVSEEAAKRARQEIEAEIEDRLLHATFDMVDRAKTVVSALMERLESFKKKDKTSGAKSFRDSILTNIETTANLIESMNITNNPEITKVVWNLNRLVNVSAHTLRNYEGERLKVLTIGQEVMANLAMLELKDKEVSSLVADAGEYMD